MNEQELFNLVGKTYNDWTIVAYMGRDKFTQVVFKIRCVCGTEEQRRAGSILKSIQKDNFTKCDACMEKEFTLKSGDKINKWTIIDGTPTRDEKGRLSYLAECECGMKKLLQRWRVINGQETCCFSCAHTKRRGKKHKINHNRLVGNRYGNLIVLEKTTTPEEIEGGQTKVFYLCQCSCGNKESVYKYDLINGYVKRCRSCLAGKKDDKHKDFNTTLNLDQFPSIPSNNEFYKPPFIMPKSSSLEEKIRDYIGENSLRVFSDSFKEDLGSFMRNHVAFEVRLLINHAEIFDSKLRALIAKAKELGI